MENINLTEQIMQTIHEKDVKMKSRSYFIVGSLLVGIGVFALFVISILFINFSWQHMRVLAPFGYLRFGVPGLLPFLYSFPWIPSIAASATVLIGLYFLKKYDFSYKHNFIVITLALINALIVAGGVIDASGFNERVHTVPPFRQFIRQEFHTPVWVVGEITQIHDPLLPLNNIRLTVLTPNKMEVSIEISKNTVLPTGMDLNEGDIVQIIGTWNNKTFEASGIKKAHIRLKRMSMTLSKPAYIILY